MTVMAGSLSLLLSCDGSRDGGTSDDPWLESGCGKLPLSTEEDIDPAGLSTLTPSHLIGASPVKHVAMGNGRILLSTARKWLLLENDGRSVIAHGNGTVRDSDLQDAERFVVSTPGGAVEVRSVSDGAATVRFVACLEPGKRLDERAVRLGVDGTDVIFLTGGGGRSGNKTRVFDLTGDFRQPDRFADVPGTLSQADETALYFNSSTGWRVVTTNGHVEKGEGHVVRLPGGKGFLTTFEGIGREFTPDGSPEAVFDFPFDATDCWAASKELLVCVGSDRAAFFRPGDWDTAVADIPGRVFWRESTSSGPGLTSFDAPLVPLTPAVGARGLWVRGDCEEGDAVCPSVVVRADGASLEMVDVPAEVPGEPAAWDGEGRILSRWFNRALYDTSAEGAVRTLSSAGVIHAVGNDQIAIATFDDVQFFELNSGEDLGSVRYDLLPDWNAIATQDTTDPESCGYPKLCARMRFSPDGAYLAVALQTSASYDSCSTECGEGALQVIRVADRTSILTLAYPLGREPFYFSGDTLVVSYWDGSTKAYAAPGFSETVLVPPRSLSPDGAHYLTPDLDTWEHQIQIRRSSDDSLVDAFTGVRGYTWNSANELLLWRTKGFLSIDPATGAAEETKIDGLRYGCQLPASREGAGVLLCGDRKLVELGGKTPEVFDFKATPSLHWCESLYSGCARGIYAERRDWSVQLWPKP